jgi:hypothetical protein
LFAKSSARSNGILPIGQLKGTSSTTPPPYSPDALQMHGPNFDHMSHFFTLKNTISSASSHSCNIQKLCTINHVIVCDYPSAHFETDLKKKGGGFHHTLSSSNTNSFCLNLETQATFIFPQGCSNSGFHAGRSYLASSIKSLLRSIALTRHARLSC